MKLSITLFLSMLAIGYSALAEPSNHSEYFICEFNEAYTNCELNQLHKQGFVVVQQDTILHVVYVKTISTSAIFSNDLKDKMKQLIMVDRSGNHVKLSTEQTGSPEFLKLLFNFI